MAFETIDIVVADLKQCGGNSLSCNLMSESVTAKMQPQLVRVFYWNILHMINKEYIHASMLFDGHLLQQIYDRICLVIIP